MNRTGRGAGARAVVSAALALALVAGAVEARVVVTPCAARVTPRAKGARVESLDHLPDRPFRILATIFESTNGPSGLRRPDLAFWSEELEPAARRAGADAVVDLRGGTSLARGVNWVSGLLVEYDAAPDTTAFVPVVAVLWPDNRTSNRDDLRRRDSAATQEAACFALAAHGWHGIAVERGGTLDALFAANAESLAALAGPTATHLFLPMLEGRVGSGTIGFRSDAVFSGSLIDARGPALVWGRDAVRQGSRQTAAGLAGGAAGAALQGFAWPSAVVSLSLSLVGSSRGAVVHEAMDRMMRTLPRPGAVAALRPAPPGQEVVR